MFCRQCGTQLQEGAKFCPACGNPVAAVKAETAAEAAPVAEPKPVEPQPQPGGYQQPGYQSGYGYAPPQPQPYVPPTQPAQHRSGSSPAITWTIRLLALFGACGLFFALISSRSVFGSYSLSGTDFLELVFDSGFDMEGEAWIVFLSMAIPVLTFLLSWTPRGTGALVPAILQVIAGLAVALGVFEGRFGAQQIVVILTGAAVLILAIVASTMKRRS